MRTPYPLGAIPDRPDPRDHKFSAPQAVVLQAGTIDRRFYTMVNKEFRINQYDEGTCVGHKSTNMLLAGPSTHPAYPDFQTEELAHQFARKLYLEGSGDSTYQQGMYPRDAAQKLKDWGLIESYQNVPQVDEVITAVLAVGPVGIALPWYSSMFYKNGMMSNLYGNYYIKVSLDSELAGYHDIAITGVDMAPDNGSPAFLRIQNSWGEGWGHNGTARLLVEDFRKLNLWDNWIFVEKVF